MTSPLQRLWQDSTHALKADGGHRSMHFASEPPGQSDGVGGVGDGVYAGLQPVHHLPLQSTQFGSDALQYAVVLPQYFPSQEQ